MKQFLSYFVLGLSLVLIFSACDKNRVFEKNIQIKNNNWDKDAGVEFIVDIQDTVTPHSMYLNIRHAGYYQFRNIYLFIETTLPNGNSQIDTAECIFATPEGKWKGDGIGDIWDNQILFKRSFHFPLKGQYHFKLTQAMRINPLPGIMDAGIRIEKNTD